MDDYQELRRAQVLEAEHDRGHHLDHPHGDCPHCRAKADADFGYTPGEDRCPAAERILANEAFLDNAELAVLITCHPACCAGLG
jgi:hypothetical protein